MSTSHDAALRALEKLDCVMVEICEPHSGNPSPNIIPVDRARLIEALSRSDTVATPSQGGEADWIRIPKPTIADLSAIGEAAEGAILSEKGWAEIGHVVWDLISVDAEVTDWSSAIRGKFYDGKEEAALSPQGGSGELRLAAMDAIALIEGGRLYEQQCCNGHMCGCRGSTYADEIVHHLRQALKATPDTGGEHIAGAGE